MNFKSVALAIKKLIVLNMENKNIEKDVIPSTSFIYNELLTSKIGRVFIEKFGVEKTLPIIYTVFYLFEGDDFETAKQKGENGYYIEIMDVSQINNISVECDECGGSTNIQCPNCSGSGVDFCEECGGSGEFDGESCDYCRGDGEITCYNCEGNETVECDECSGYGEVESNEKEATLRSNIWATNNVTTYNKMLKLYKDNYYGPPSKLMSLLDDEAKTVVFVTSQNRFDTIDYNELESDYPNIREDENFISSLGSWSDVNFEMYTMGNTTDTDYYRLKIR